jgi:hypothetical protein
MSPQTSSWQKHIVRQLNGRERFIELPAQFQVVNDHWKQFGPRMPNVGFLPDLAYMPEKDRLLMSVQCHYPKPPYHTAVITSDDHGATWSERRWLHTDASGEPDITCSGLTYLGKGQLTINASDKSRGYSSDYGQTWTLGSSRPLTRDGEFLYPGLDTNPLLVDRDPAGNIIRLAETCWKPTGVPWGSTEGPYSQAYLLFSTDLGRTWSTELKVPQWLGLCEIALVRAKNGDIIASCRTDSPKRYAPLKFDHYGGMGVSISRDNGQTWSELHWLYEWGRHHGSMVVLPDGRIVMSYVVRLGYTDTPDGSHRFGIEAIVSNDHGKTWDLDHRYLLSIWTGIIKGDLEHNVCQSTSSILLPDGNILTAFGTGFRNSNPEVYNMEFGLVKWRVNDQPTNNDRTIADAPFDSDLRNIFDPSSEKQ